MSNCFSDILSQNRIISSLALCPQHPGAWSPTASLQLLNPFSPTSPGSELGSCWFTFSCFILFLTVLSFS